jgi:uncharacterized protein (TIGR02145 family)
MNIKTSNWLFGIIMIMIVIVSFLTASCEKDNVGISNVIVDGDGNVYHSVIIGEQEWLTENLKTTRYNDGTPIPLVTSQYRWTKLTSPGYCFYDNDEESNKEIYGALYNWYAVNTGKLCPVGYDVPNNVDWIQLIYYAGGQSEFNGAGLELNIGSNNSTRFSAVPAGWRADVGFLELGKKASFISNEPIEISVCAFTSYTYQDRVDYGGGELNVGLSVRCIKK